MGQTFNRVLGMLSLTRIPDTQCGFKAFRRKAVAPIFSRQTLDGFAFDVEVLMLAERLGFQARDLPVEWLNSPESKVNIIRDSARMLRDALRIRRLAARQRPELERADSHPSVVTPSRGENQ
jgi:dolichyl-phosphate beta-glucosyltransferase